MIRRWLVCREKKAQGLTYRFGNARTRRDGVRPARRWASNNLHGATLLLTEFRLSIQARLTKLGRTAERRFRCPAARSFETEIQPRRKEKISS